MLWKTWVIKKLLNHLQASTINYSTIIIFKGMEFSRKALEACRKLTPAATWVNINPDDPFNIVARGASNLNVLESISFFDVATTLQLIDDKASEMAFPIPLEPPNTIDSITL